MWAPVEPAEADRVAVPLIPWSKRYSRRNAPPRIETESFPPTPSLDRLWDRSAAGCRSASISARAMGMAAYSVLQALIRPDDSAQCRPHFFLRKHHLASCPAVTS